MAHYWLPDATSGTGTGNWSATGATGHWADNAGGTNLGKAAPTSTDSVFFGATAFNGAGQTVTVDATANVKDLSFVGSLNTPTLAGTATVNVYGSVTFIAAMTQTSGLTILSQSTGAQSVTTNGLSLGLSLGFYSTGTTTLQDNFTTIRDIDYQSGSFNTNGKTLSLRSFGVYSATAKTISFGSSTITCSNKWEYTGTNLTISANTATINDAGNFTNTAGLNFNGATLNLTGATSTITGNNTFANLTFDASAAAAQTITLPASGTQTVSGTFTATGDSTANRCTIQSSSAGTSSTINAATVAVTKSDLKDLIGAGAGSWDMGATSDVRHVSGGSGITYRAFWSADTGNWSDYGNKWATLSGGTTRLLAAPDSVTNVYFDALSFTAGSKTVTVDALASCKTFNTTGTTNTPNIIMTSGIQVYGDVTLSGITTSGAAAIILNASGTVTTNGITIPMFTSWNAATINIADALTVTNILRVGSGIFVTNGKAITCGTFSDYGSADAKTWTLGASTITCGTFSFTGSNNTVSANTAIINDSGNFSCTAGANFNGATLNLTGATSTITGNNTFAQLNLASGTTQAITATGTTQTFKSLIRNAGNQVKTLVNGTYTRLPGGGVNLDYMSISGSTATTALYAGPLTHSTDGGGNTGWVFQCNPECRISRMRRYLAAGVV